ncbi:MAG: NAD(P)-dependent oxidoreductase [Planctomycetota bacterium]|nr:NAD(P)-dependent oxidoreductase [Planctomycetota bacterium]
MRILVTGATGFLGGATARRLAELGHEVVGTGRDPEAGARLAERGIHFVPAELGDRESIFGLCEGMEWVVHSAALSSPWGPWETFFEANVTGTRHVAMGCLLAGVKRLVHISTPGIYANGKNRLDLSEEASLFRPLNHYVATKRLAEAAVLEAGAAGLEVVILRPRGIIGPGDQTIVPRILRALEAGRLPVVGGRSVLADMTVIDNAVHAIECALVAPVAGRIFNITGGEPVPLWDLVDDLCRRLDLTPPSRKLSYRLAWFLAGQLERWHRLFPSRGEPVLTRYGVCLIGRSLTLDISAARRDLGYDPQVSIREGVERFVAWWKERER